MMYEGDNNIYKSFNDWRKRFFPNLQRELELEEIRKDLNKFTEYLVNESIKKNIR